MPRPARVFASTGLIPAARTRTRTSVGIGSGRSACSRRRTSGPPNSRSTTARIRALDRRTEARRRSRLRGRRAWRRTSAADVIDEQVRVHPLRDLLDVRLAEAHPEPAADDHRLGVEQVDRRGDPGAERLERPLHQLLGKRVGMLQRSLPDAAREAVLSVLLHDLEELRRLAGGVVAARLRLHRATARIGLHAAPAAARTERPALLDHHVADLTRRATPDPSLAVEDQAAADPGAPEDPEDRPVRLAGAELELRVGGDVDVVRDPHRRPESVGKRRAERKASLPPGRLPRLGDVAGLLVGVARRADPDPGQRVGLHARPRRPPRPAPAPSPPPRRRVRPRSASGVAPAP